MLVLFELDHFDGGVSAGRSRDSRGGWGRGLLCRRLLHLRARSRSALIVLTSKYIIKIYKLPQLPNLQFFIRNSVLLLGFALI